MNNKVKIIILAVTAVLLLVLLFLGKRLESQRVPDSGTSSGTTETTQAATTPENFTIPDDTWEATPWG